MSARLRETLSPLLFVIYLEAGLRDLRTFYNDSITEIVYADDVDFASDNIDDLIHLLNNSPRVLNKWFLIINTFKTELTEIKRMDTRIGETWRNANKLGSLLEDSEDISRRKMLATAALSRIRKKWLQAWPISRALGSRFYNAFVKPVLLYNSSTWGISDTELKTIDSFHPKQLRLLHGIHWPSKINNLSLYKHYDATPLSQEIVGGRWKLFAIFCEWTPELRPIGQWTIIFPNMEANIVEDLDPLFRQFWRGISNFMAKVSKTGTT
ncbi:uncharacterized protein LOC115229511 [Octopus sinensis]|uniref:Uncharacterized protein LOC115229511 n=1 Tax=Octopus sinensis TaxID=2607531 RepID=A0A6P7U2H2_9MOLL|nr:uncharacterized protein LOC115229511 [Octopus sinensis]